MELVDKTGLTVLQLNNWFINSRRRKFKSLIDKSRPQLQQTNKDKSKQSSVVEPELKKGRLSCPYCQESFNLKKYLTKHMKKGECQNQNISNSRHICGLCGKTFAQKRNLDRHVMIAHETDPSKGNTFNCPKCIKSFTLKQTLTRHLGRCNIFKNPGPKKNHLCSICKIAFVNKSALYKHVQKVHEKIENTRKPHQYSSGPGTPRYILPKPSTMQMKQNHQNYVATLPLTQSTPIQTLATVQFIDPTAAIPPQKTQNWSPIRTPLGGGTEGILAPPEFGGSENIIEKEIDNSSLGLLPVEKNSGLVKQDMNNLKESKQILHVILKIHHILNSFSYDMPTT